MLVARVVHHEVEDHLDPTLVAGGDERVEVGVGSQQRVDRRMVADVVAEIAPGRRVDRRQPDRVDRQCLGAEVVEVIEDLVPLRDVACAVRVPESVNAVTLEPQGESLPFTRKLSTGTLRFSARALERWKESRRHRAA